MANYFPQIVTSVLGMKLHDTFKLQWAPESPNMFIIQGLYRFDEYGLQRRSRRDGHWYYVSVWLEKILTGQVIIKE